MFWADFCEAWEAKQSEYVWCMAPGREGGIAERIPAEVRAFGMSLAFLWPFRQILELRGRRSFNMSGSMEHSTIRPLVGSELICNELFTHIYRPIMINNVHTEGLTCIAREHPNLLGSRSWLRSRTRLRRLVGVDGGASGVWLQPKNFWKRNIKTPPKNVEKLPTSETLRVMFMLFFKNMFQFSGFILIVVFMVCVWQVWKIGVYTEKESIFDGWLADSHSGTSPHSMDWRDPPPFLMMSQRVEGADEQLGYAFSKVCRDAVLKQLGFTVSTK